MDNLSNPKLKTIDAVMLTPLVRRCLERGKAELIDWEYAALQGGSFNSEIYRFSGNARERGEVLHWSMILKIIRSPDGKNEPAALKYWKREALAYQSGLLRNVGAHFRRQFGEQSFGVGQRGFGHGVRAVESR